MIDQEKTLTWYILSYLWIFALIPLLVERDDGDVQWHSKNGLLLFGAELAVFIVLIIFTTTWSFFLPGFLWIFSCFLWTIVWMGVLSLHIVCIIKALRGERFAVPYLSSLVEKF